MEDSRQGFKRPLDEGQPEEDQLSGPPAKRLASGDRAEAVLRLVVPARKVGGVRLQRSPPYVRLICCLIPSDFSALFS